MSYTLNTKQTHCSDDKYEPKGQPTFPVNWAGSTESVEPDEVTLLENTDHFSSPYQSSDMRSSIEGAHVHSQQLLHQAKAQGVGLKLAAGYGDKERRHA